MIQRASTATAFAAVLLLCSCSSPHSSPKIPASRPVDAAADVAETIALDHPALFPESVVFDAPRERFIVGSFREGALYEADMHGRTRLFAEDPRLVSVLGVAIDAPRHRLFAANADLGAGRKASPGGARTLAALAVYDLLDASPIRYVDLGGLLPDRAHLANGLTVDQNGTAYVTDSFASAIYAVPTDGDPSVLVESRSAFGGEGIGLNGLVALPDGYLLVVKKNDGKLFRVSTAANASVEEVALPRPLIAADGVVLVAPDRIVVISNESNGAIANEVVMLSSEDGWKSATITGQLSLGRVYPTGGVIAHEHLFVLHSELNQLINGKPETRDSMRNAALLDVLGEGDPIVLRPK